MSKVADEVARLALMELADGFGVTRSPQGQPDPFEDWSVLEDGKMEVKPPTLLSMAMDGRLYADDGKAVYVLLKPLKLENGEFIELIRMREPSVPDYLDYSKGFGIKVKNGEANLEPDMLLNWTVKVVSVLGGIPLGVIKRQEGGMTKRDGMALMEVCQALGFFE